MQSKVLTPKRYTVDLGLPPEDRWDELLTDKWAVRSAVGLCKDVTEKIPYYVRPFLRTAVGLADQGELDYLDDVDIWSEYAIGDQNAARLANFSYELYGIANFPGNIWKTLRKRVGLCTSVAFHIPKLGMVHARNMDWPVDGIKELTILVDFKNGPSGPFTAVTVPGLTGVLSGVAKGRFSATINAAEDETVPFTPNLSGWSALWLLRWIFEYCESYDEAVAELKRQKSFVPFFVQLVGTKKGEACVIAVRPKRRNKVYKYQGGPLGISNHYPDGDFADTEWEEAGEVYETDFIERLECIQNSACKCKAKTLKGVLCVLRQEPVLNEMTMQSMAFCPKTGEVLLNRIP